jgi:hypothetical protein
MDRTDLLIVGPNRVEGPAYSGFPGFSAGTSFGAIIFSA